MADQEIFRLNYNRLPDNVADSKRARLRLFKLFDRLTDDEEKSAFVEVVKSKLGYSFPYGGYNYDFLSFFNTAPIDDVLSSLIFICRMKRGDPSVISAIQEIFTEEQLRYTINERGGVHFLVDTAFEHSVAAAIAGLGEPRFKGALHAFQSGLEAITPAKQSGKTLF